MKKLTLEVRGLFEELDHLAVERHLSALGGVHSAEANPASASVTVHYDETAVGEEELRNTVEACGFHCAGERVPNHVCHADHQMSGAEAPAGHDAMAHEMGHGGGMDMASMVRDMRNRFWVALLFTIPIFTYSPMGGLFTPPAPPFGLELDLWLFFLGSAAIIWPSWPFFVAAWRALRNGILNMAVLVVLSVGTGYVFSVGSTFFFPGVQFYEAVAVLLVFILLGHWLEMRARAGASVDRGSDHPLALAIVERAADLDVPQMAEFLNLEGRGARAEVAGKTVLVGNRRLMDEEGIDVGTLTAEAERLKGEGRTVVHVAQGGRMLGLMAIADAPRPSAKATVAKLRARGVEVAMLTGDNEGTARRIAGELGIDIVLADVLPGQKAEKVKELQAQGKKVGMVGDGVNDAPALTQADVGFAIGAGTDVAMESADVVLMKSDPYDVVGAIELSRATLRKMHQNLFWAVAYNVVAFPMAAGVFYPLIISPAVAALAMSGSSALVAVNALLLKRTRLEGIGAGKSGSASGGGQGDAQAGQVPLHAGHSQKSH